MVESGWMMGWIAGDSGGELAQLSESRCALRCLLAARARSTRCEYLAGGVDSAFSFATAPKPPDLVRVGVRDGVRVRVTGRVRVRVRVRPSSPPRLHGR